MRCVRARSGDVELSVGCAGAWTMFDGMHDELISALLFAAGVFLLVFLPRYGEKAEFLKLTFGQKK